MNMYHIQQEECEVLLLQFELLFCNRALCYAPPFIICMSSIISYNPEEFYGYQFGKTPVIT